MRTHRLFSSVFFLSLSSCLALSALANGGLNVSARAAVSEDAALRASALKSLREAGPAGLEALFAEYAVEIEGRAGAGREGGAEWARIAEALDAVSQQRDGFASRLYWYTDFEEAKRAARASGKPILSLRLLGKLSEEYSCANSRFFRTVLYANTTVSKFLRENFVLHWQSVRPAPRVTIDFGDGRRLVRTVTGNSVHYVLDPEGWPIDALPGLYGPQAFLRELERAAEVTRASARLGGEARNQFLFNYYTAQALQLMDSVRSDARAAGVALPAEAIQRQTGGAPPRGTITPPKPLTVNLTAIVAMPRAMTKMVRVEERLTREVTYNFTYRPGSIERAINEDGWARIAGLHLADARLDAASVALLASHNPHTHPATQSKTAAADTTGAGRFARAVANLERTMALDTVRNEYLLRPILLRWLADGAGLDGVEELNRRVYAELFLTPDSDPWLGLAAPDSYTGLLNDGVVTNR